MDYGKTFKELQLDTIDFSQNMLRAYETNEYPVQNNDASKDILYFHAQTNNWADLSESYLELQIQLTKAGNVPFVVGDVAEYNAVLTNAWSIADRVRLDIDTTQVETCDSPGKIANLRNLATKSRANMDSCAEWEGYFPMISADGASQVNLALTTGYTRANKYMGTNGTNAVERNGEYRACTVHLPLNQVLGFCTVKKLLRGGKYVLSISKNKLYNHYLFRQSTDSVATELHILNASWMIPSLSLQSDAEVSGTALQAGGTPIPFDYQAAEYVPLANMLNKKKITLKSGIKNVRRVYIGFRPSANDSTQTESAFNYVDPGIKRISLVINNQHYPAVPYQQNNLAQIPLAYQDFLRLEGRSLNDLGDTISFQEWSASANIWVFDLSMENPIFGGVSAEQSIFLDYDGGNVSYIADCVLEFDQHVDVDELGGKLRVQVSG